MSTKIRAKFIEHMEYSGLAKQTQRSYITGVKGLANHHNNIYHDNPFVSSPSRGQAICPFPLFEKGVTGLES